MKWSCLRRSFMHSQQRLRQTPNKLTMLAVMLVCIAGGCDQSTPADNRATPQNSVTVPVPLAPVVGSVEPMEGNSPEYRRGYEAGAAQAEQEFANDAATIYVYGLLSSGEKLDRETGLLETEIAGCIVSDFILGRTDGHNERILELIHQNGYPSYSRKKWENELFTPAQFFSTRTPGEIQVLRTGATDVMLDHGRIRLSARSEGLRIYVNGTPLTRRTVANEVRTILDAPMGIVPRSTEVTLGPGGSDTVFFRWTFVDSKPRLGVLDVRNGEWLRIERSDGESR